MWSIRWVSIGEWGCNVGICSMCTRVQWSHRLSNVFIEWMAVVGTFMLLMMPSKLAWAEMSLCPWFTGNIVALASAKGMCQECVEVTGPYIVIHCSIFGSCPRLGSCWDGPTSQEGIWRNAKWWSSIPTPKYLVLSWKEERWRELIQEWSMRRPWCGRESCGEGPQPGF